MRARKFTVWQRRAAYLGAKIPVGELHDSCRRWIEHNPEARWAVGFSGGGDSLALLLLLWAHFPSRRKRLLVVHFNHRLRGREALGDEKFCHRVCASLGVKCRVGRWTEAKRGASEAAARSARHAFFELAMKETRSKCLWLGHQQDDIAETMFMRLARGSGTSGLAAPRPLNVVQGGRVHLRPLLTLKKATIAVMLQAGKISWREDATNDGPAYLRNRVRAAVMPAWIEASQGRDAVAGAALSRELLEEDDDALEAWVEEVAPFNTDGSLNLNLLAGKPRGLVRRALHRWLLSMEHRVNLSRQAFNALLEDVMSRRPTRHSVGTGCFVNVSPSAACFVADRKIAFDSTGASIDL